MDPYKTLEIMAKYIAEHTDTKVRFKPDTTPCADPKTREIWIPSNVAEEHIYPAIALAWHEGAHLKYTTYDYSKLASNQNEFNVLNAIEDARIDHKNICELPNVSAFYRELYASMPKKTLDKVPPGVIALCDCIMMYEGFYEHISADNSVESIRAQIWADFRSAIQYLDIGAYEKAKAVVQAITKIVFPDMPAEQKEDQQEQESGQEGSGKSETKKSKDGDQKGGKPCEATSGTGGFVNGDFLKMDKSQKGVDPNPIGDIAITEATRRRFEEMLKTTEQRLIGTDAGILDTDNLTAFFTEDIDGLFKEEVVETPKKSRIVIVLDGSGSMSGCLIDGNSRVNVARAAAKSIIKSIEAVNKAEGTCVDWEIGSFEGGYWPLKKET